MTEKTSCGSCNCETENNGAPQDASKRDFMVLAASATAGIGAACAAVPILSQMMPAADTLALSSVEVKIDDVKVGDTKRVLWQGKPVFIKRRTAEEIAAAKKDDGKPMPDAQTDAERVKEGKEEWLVVIGVCTHLGCIPNNVVDSDDAWFCPCHGSHYDFSGRIRKGPAPKNLAVPPYQFLNDTTIKIG
jgi:ubiquinol-cytochrome c reductase iron-sulfur subunit